jgi:pimeloyl-ACP methyl ester carboxylesterase
MSLGVQRRLRVQFDSDGVRLAYEEAGEGPPILLIHGFASNARVNWRDTSWFKALSDAGRRVIAIDNRGHGESEKLYDPALYSAAIMAEDARRLLDYLRIERVDAMGYSMGARIATLLAIAHPSRVRRAVLAGLAGNMLGGFGHRDAIVAALEAPTLADVAERGARSFRAFAEQTKSDLKALAACMRSRGPRIDSDMLAKVSCPTLVVAGEKDDLAGPVAPLVDAIAGARGLTLPGRNHMNAVGDKSFKRAVIAFLAEPP